MEELELIAGCVKGEQKSRIEFLEKYSRLIYTYIKAVVINKGYTSFQQHIEDIFQELYCMLFEDDARKLRSFKALNGCTLASWLRQVTIHFTVDYLQRVSALSAVSLDDEIAERLPLEAAVRDPGAPVSETLIEEEYLQKLKECIEALDTQARYFLELHLHRGVSLHDIKEHLQTTRGAIDMYKSRLIARLRDCFKAQGLWHE